MAYKPVTLMRLKTSLRGALSSVWKHVKIQCHWLKTSSRSLTFLGGGKGIASSLTAHITLPQEASTLGRQVEDVEKLDSPDT